jgi:predicted branched-subunit amino acid permease
MTTGLRPPEHDYAADPVTTPSPWADFRAGARDIFPVLFAGAPFGALFGAIAIEQGMTQFQAILMSATLYAGASQFVALGLWDVPLPTLAIILSVFAVNFRHLLYSASIARHIPHFSPGAKATTFLFLTDPHFGACEQRAQHTPLTLAYNLGLALPLYEVWVGSTWVGTVFGKLIENPDAIGVDVLLPFYFLGLVLAFRQRANWLPVVIVSGLAALMVQATIGEPWHIAGGALFGVLFAALRGKPPEKPEPVTEVRHAD